MTYKIIVNASIRGNGIVDNNYPVTFMIEAENDEDLRLKLFNAEKNAALTFNATPIEIIKY